MFDLRNKEIVKNICILGVLIGVLKVLIYGTFFGDDPENTIENNILLIFSGHGLGSGQINSSLLLYLVEHFSLAAILGFVYINDIERNGAYIYTRTNRRERFIHKKTVSILVWVFLYYIVQFGVVFLLNLSMGKNIKQIDLLISVIFVLGLSMVLQTFLFLLIHNVTTLFIPKNIAQLLIVALNMFCILTTAFISSMSIRMVGVIKFLPFVQGIYVFHESVFHESGLEQEILLTINEFSMTFSFLYNIALLILTCFIGIKKIKKMDII